MSKVVVSIQQGFLPDGRRNAVNASNNTRSNTQLVYNFCMVVTNFSMHIEHYPSFTRVSKNRSHRNIYYRIISVSIKRILRNKTIRIKQNLKIYIFHRMSDGVDIGESQIISTSV